MSGSVSTRKKLPSSSLLLFIIASAMVIASAVIFLYVLFGTVPPDKIGTMSNISSGEYRYLYLDSFQVEGLLADDKAASTAELLISFRYPDGTPALARMQYSYTGQLLGSAIDTGGCYVWISHETNADHYYDEYLEKARAIADDSAIYTERNIEHFVINTAPYFSLADHKKEQTTYTLLHVIPSVLLVIALVLIAVAVIQLRKSRKMQASPAAQPIYPDMSPIYTPDASFGTQPATNFGAYPDTQPAAGFGAYPDTQPATDFGAYPDAQPAAGFGAYPDAQPAAGFGASPDVSAVYPDEQPMDSKGEFSQHSHRISSKHPVFTEQTGNSMYPDVQPGEDEYKNG